MSVYEMQNANMSLCAQLCDTADKVFDAVFFFVCLFVFVLFCFVFVFYLISCPMQKYCRGSGRTRHGQIASS